MKTCVILLLLAVSLSGCKTVTSSVHYTTGTDAIKAGDYDTAIRELKIAVEEDPDLSRNQNNLAHAYFEKGMIQEGWPHIRKAVMLDPRNKYAYENFNRYFRKLVEIGDVKDGLTLGEVVLAIGQPDNQQVSNGMLMCQFGWVVLYFTNDRLTGYNEMEYR